MSLITIDLRMYKSSGIGTYISNIVPLIISKMPEHKFTFLGDVDELKVLLCSNASNTSLLNLKSPIYSISEQIELAKVIPKDTALFWSPHYNIPLFYPGKLLVTVHDVFHLAMPEFLGGWHRQTYAKLMFAALKRKATAIISVSEFTSKELTRMTGISRDRISVIHEGVDSSWFSVSANSRLVSKPYLLFVGNVKPHKNLTRLLDAFELLVDKIPHDLVIVGKKEGFITHDRNVVAKAEKFGTRIHFTGHVSFDALQQYYVHADAFVFPSLYEGFGFPPLEAMACGCPVVVSETASIPEVCCDSAMYFNPYRADDIAGKIFLLLKDKNLQCELASKGKEQARKFLWEKCACSTSKVIRELLNN